MEPILSRNRPSDKAGTVQRFLMVKLAADLTPAPTQLHLIRNWTDELEEIVPVN